MQRRERETEHQHGLILRRLIVLRGPVQEADLGCDIHRPYPPSHPCARRDGDIQAPIVFDMNHGRLRLEIDVQLDAFAIKRAQMPERRARVRKRCDPLPSKRMFEQERE